MLAIYMAILTLLTAVLKSSVVAVLTHCLKLLNHDNPEGPDLATNTVQVDILLDLIYSCPEKFCGCCIQPFSQVPESWNPLTARSFSTSGHALKGQMQQLMLHGLSHYVFKLFEFSVLTLFTAVRMLVIYVAILTTFTAVLKGSVVAVMNHCIKFLDYEILLRSCPLLHSTMPWGARYSNHTSRVISLYVRGFSFWILNVLMTYNYLFNLLSTSC